MFVNNYLDSSVTIYGRCPERCFEKQIRVSAISGNSLVSLNFCGNFLFLKAETYGRLAYFIFEKNMIHLR